MHHLIEALPTVNLIEALPTATKFINEMTYEVLLQSCDALFHGDKTGFLAKCTSQPPVLKQKSTSQATGCTSQVARSTSQLGRSTSQVHLVYTVELSYLTVQGRTF